MRKAGWTGRKDEWKKVGDLKVVTYLGKIKTLKYAEYIEWKTWIADYQGESTK